MVDRQQASQLDADVLDFPKEFLVPKSKCVCVAPCLFRNGPMVCRSGCTHPLCTHVLVFAVELDDAVCGTVDGDVLSQHGRAMEELGHG
jgi:hypothetical protein